MFYQPGFTWFSPPQVADTSLALGTQTFGNSVSCSPGTVSIGPPPVLPITATAPSFQVPTFTLPAPPSVSLNANLGGVSAGNISIPGLSFPSAPSAPTGSIPAPPGIMMDFEIGDVNPSMPSPPSLLQIQVTPFGGLNFPDPNLNEPIITLVPPQVMDYTPGLLYDSALLSYTRQTLQSRIQNGGTGLPPAVEQAIWDRAREREYKQMAAALADVDRMETLGYAFPPGVYADARLKIQTEANYNIANQSREIMIKQAELELSNIQKALELVVPLESKLMEYQNQIEQRAFEKAKYLTSAHVEVYNAQVKMFGMQVEMYKARIAVYESQIKAEATKVEVYKAQIQAEEAKAQVNKALVDMYKSQVDAAMAYVEIYKVKIGALQARAELEKAKVGIYAEQIKGYAAGINVFTSQIEAYKAQVSAETAKMEGAKAQAQVISANVDAQAKVIQANAEVLKGQATIAAAQYEGYKAQASVEAERVRASGAVVSAQAQIYAAEVQAQGSVAEASAKVYAASAQAQASIAGIGAECAKAQATVAASANSALAEVEKGKLAAQAQVMAARLNQYSVSNTASASYSVSNTYSESLSA